MILEDLAYSTSCEQRASQRGASSFTHTLFKTWQVLKKQVLDLAEMQNNPWTFSHTAHALQRDRFLGLQVCLKFFVELMLGVHRS